MSLKNVENALDLAQEKIEAARVRTEHLEDSPVADVCSLLAAAVDELHNAVTDLASEVEAIKETKETKADE